MLRTPRPDITPDPRSSPFSLDRESAYRRWRARKLLDNPVGEDPPVVPLASLRRLEAGEREALVSSCRRTNFALYRTEPRAVRDTDDLRAFGEQLGLTRFERPSSASAEGVVALRLESGGARARYIPFTDRALKWHTDGYYNPPDSTVRGVVMHCVTPAARGGANWLLDPEMVYIAVRDRDPALVEALMHPRAMTIPGNELEPGRRGGAISGAVFSVDHEDGSLHMRYTARTRSIEWRDDGATRAAVALLDELLAAPSPFALRVGLEAGQGIVCNNVLHAREAFEDGPATDQRRLLWRARYLERVAGTGWRCFDPLNDSAGEAAGDGADG